MKQHIIYIYVLLAGVLGLNSCADDDDVLEQEMEYCLQMPWHDGRGGGETRTLMSFLQEASGGDLELSPDEYPDEIMLSCIGKDIKLTRETSLDPCDEHVGFYHGYTPDYPLKNNEAKKGVTALANLDGIEELYSKEDDVEVDGLHLKITMHHSKALLRFAFKVDPRYDKIRYILVTDITLNDAPCFLVDKVLNVASSQLIAYCYIDPTVVTVSYENTIKCTYDIYDKDAIFTPAADGIVSQDDITANESHRTREGVIARNTFKLNSLKDAFGVPVSQIQAGYYYDLRVTLNPDYLYVLSDHDNTHLLVQ